MLQEQAQYVCMLIMITEEEMVVKFYNLFGGFISLHLNTTDTYYYANFNLATLIM